MQKVFFILFLSIAQLGFSQKTIDQVLKKYNSGNVEYIHIAAAQKLANAVFLDARETAEFQVSHIEKAKYVGYENFSTKDFQALKLAKNTPIIVYCSVGVRSEKIGDRLKKLGYTSVYNLYGGIFEWKNQNGVIVDSNNSKTNKVHCYSPEWGTYLTNGDCAY